MSEEIATFPELVYPKNLLVDDHQIYITDYPSVYIFSAKDYRLLKKLGRKGQGPGEFYIDQEWMDRKVAGLISHLRADLLYVNSMGRLSIFNLAGEIQKELKVNPFGGGYSFQPLGDKFVALQMARQKKSIYATINIYDENLKKLVEVLRQPFWLNNSGSREINFFQRAHGTLPFRVNGEEIFISRGGLTHCIIDVFNSAGKKLRTITHQQPAIKIPTSFVKKVHDFMRVKFKRGVEFNIKHTTYGDHFPAIRNFSVSGKRIYVITYKREGNKNQVIILDLQGTLIKKVMVPILEKNPEHLSPFYIAKGELYQLVENEESEEWELHRYKLD